MQYIEIDNNKINLTDAGFLTNPALWSESIALALAARENISLTSEHWRLIHFLRNFYTEHDHVPPLRVFIKAVQANLDNSFNSIEIHKLFPDTPMKLLSLIAGLPKPKHCI